MSNNYKTQHVQAGDIQGSEKFPNWDILPPFQFINPRPRAIEPKEETKSKRDAPVISSVFNESTTLTTQTLPSTAASPSHEMVGEKCPACGASVQTEEEFCPECGLKLTDPMSPEQQAGNNVLPKTIKCPHCGEAFELDDSDDGIGEYSCPDCGKDFEVLG